MVKSLLCAPTLFAADENQNPGTESSDKHKTPPSPPDDDTLGVVDPFLEALSTVRDSDTDEPSEGGATRGLDIDELLEPRDLGATDVEQNELDVPIDLVDDDDRGLSRGDDEQGPDILEPLTVAETTDDALPDAADEGPIEGTFFLEPAIGSKNDQSDVEGEGADNDPIGLYVDDAELPWAKDNWTERAPGQTFSARRHLALVGNTLCVAGDTTHLHDTKNDVVLEVLPITARTTRIVALDPEAKELLVLTATGQLFAYDRQAPGPVSSRLTLVSELMVSSLWQIAPGVPVVVVQGDNGQRYDYANRKLHLHAPLPGQEGSRLLALSGIGEPSVSLWKNAQALRLCVEASGETRYIPLTKALERAVASARPTLLGFNESVLVSVREHGLWLHQVGMREFLPIGGCRSLTAATAGHFGLRPTAFVGLFSELDDRAEIAMIDLSTGRATRIAELSIHSDFAGREDDPPELARIDGLVWDGSNGQLWAAGGFGLARFTPPLGPKPS